MRELLKEYIEEILIESESSEMFEQSVTDSINSFRKKGIKAARAGGNTALADVKVVIRGTTSYVEAKMNHTDNLANPRVFYDGSKWDTTYETFAAKFTVKLLNKSVIANEWLVELAKFVGRKSPAGMIIPTTKGGLLDPNAVPYSKMKAFVKSGRGGYITSEPAPIASIVTKHYNLGKSEPAHYMQAGHDFYMIGRDDPFNLLSVAPKIPLLKGSGNLKVRVSIRSHEPWYEVQAELKLTDMPISPYSALLSDTDKKNPFKLLADATT